MYDPVGRTGQLISHAMVHGLHIGYRGIDEVDRIARLGG